MASDWSIQVPLSELAALAALPGKMEALQKENAQLRRELEALRMIQSQTLEQVADLRREMRKGKHGG